VPAHLQVRGGHLHKALYSWLLFTSYDITCGNESLCARFPFVYRLPYMTSHLVRTRCVTRVRNGGCSVAADGTPERTRRGAYYKVRVNHWRRCYPVKVTRGMCLVTERSERVGDARLYAAVRTVPGTCHAPWSARPRN
jgi:hypothetical protein